MLYYEWKKIWVKTGNRIAMLILAGILALICFFAVHGVYYVNGNGDTEYGIEAVHKLKTAKKAWAGTLTEEVIAEVIAENTRINETKEGRSDETRESNIAFGWKQGFHDIRWMLMYSFCKFREADYYRPDSLIPEDAASFYGNRLLRLQEWLDEDEQQYYFSEEERQFLLQRYEALETPFQYDYADGWKQVFEFSPMFLMLMLLVLGFVAAGIFSGEFSCGADAVFFASYHGRGKAVAAKLGAGLIFITVVYFVAIFSYSVVVLGILGTDGAGLAIQTNHSGWKSFYLLTNLQEYWLIVFGGYFGTLFGSLLTMLVSAGTRSTVLAASVPFMLIFIPDFLGRSSASIVTKVIGLLPDRLLAVSQVVSIFNLYHVGGKVMGALGILFVLYAGLSILLCPLLYQVYRRMGVG